MGILEFILATGRIGALLVIAIFVVVFWFAAPGKEISFLGIRFHKRHLRLDKLKTFLPLPKPLPPDWRVVLAAFGNMDTTHIQHSRMFGYTKKVLDLTEMQTREACNQMKKRGLINSFGGYYNATERAIPLIVKNQVGAKKDA